MTQNQGFSQKIFKKFVNLKKLLFCEFGVMGKFRFSSYAYWDKLKEENSGFQNF